MKPLPDYTGQRFGRLLVLRQIGRDSRGYVLYECQCDCGKIVPATGCGLKRGHNQSCGCLMREKARDNMLIARQKLPFHGLSRTTTYTSWTQMVARCYQRGAANFKHYGGRGVEVCPYLRASVTNLVSLIGEKPAGHRMSIDRIQNAGHYSCGSCERCRALGWPLNVRWLSPYHQNRNKTNNRWYEKDGKRMILKDWMRELGLQYRSAVKRMAPYEVRT